jgi:hypothetical protein
MAMVDTPEDPEEPNAVPPPPSPPDESDSDMEEASVSSTDSSMPGLVTDSDSDDEPDGEEICRQIRICRPPRNLPTIQASYTSVGGYFPFSSIDDFHAKWRRVDVSPSSSLCEPSHSPEFYSADDSDSTPSHSPSDYEVNDLWSSSASSSDLPVNFPPLARSDGGRSRPSTFHVDGTTCRIDDWMYRVCRRRAAVRAALPAPSQEELVTYVDAPCYFRDEPRSADGGMPRFATQMEAEAAHKAAMEELSTKRMTWEEYAATHPHESMGAPPMPRSQAFPERREGQHLRLHLTKLLGTFDLALLVHAQMPIARQSL